MVDHCDLGDKLEFKTLIHLGKPAVGANTQGLQSLMSDIHLVCLWNLHVLYDMLFYAPMRPRSGVARLVDPPQIHLTTWTSSTGMRGSSPTMERATLPCV